MEEQHFYTYIFVEGEALRAKCTCGWQAEHLEARAAVVVNQNHKHMLEAHNIKRAVVTYE